MAVGAAVPSVAAVEVDSTAVEVVGSMAVADRTAAVVDMVEDTAKTLRSIKMFEKRLASRQPFFFVRNDAN